MIPHIIQEPCHRVGWSGVGWADPFVKVCLKFRRKNEMMRICAKLMEVGLFDAFGYNDNNKKRCRP